MPGFAGSRPSPSPIWLDTDGKYFAEVSFISTMPAGFEGNNRAMLDFQDAETAKAVRAIAHQFRTGAARAPVLFDNVRLFDADKGVFVDNQAVLAVDGKIKAIAAAGSIAPPAGAKVIDGRGKTLVPGLWDSHLHIGDDWNVLANMATGITSFRSPGTDIERAVDAVKRRNSGDLLMGEPFVAHIIDQKHPLAAQGAEVVTSEAEAIAAVRRMQGRRPVGREILHLDEPEMDSGRLRPKRTGWACRCSATSPRRCGRSTRSRPAMTRSPTSTSS